MLPSGIAPRIFSSLIIKTQQSAIFTQLRPIYPIGKRISSLQREHVVVTGGMTLGATSNSMKEVKRLFHNYFISMNGAISWPQKSLLTERNYAHLLRIMPD